jgi:hypothetical protein
MMDEAEYVRRQRKRKARAIQAENPGMNYTTALRQVIAAEEAEEAKNGDS